MAVLFKADAETVPDPPYEFDLLQQENGCIFERLAAAKWTGDYGFRAMGNGVGDYAYGYKSLSSLYKLYARYHAYIPPILHFNGSSVRCAFLTCGNFFMLGVHIGASGYPDQWMIYSWGIGGYNYIDGFSFGWHCIEGFCDGGTGSDGVTKMWVDQELIFDADGLSQSGKNLNFIKSGLVTQSTLPDSGAYIFVDDLEINTEGPIGPAGKKYYQSIGGILTFSGLLAQILGKQEIVLISGEFNQLVSLSGEIKQIVETEGEFTQLINLSGDFVEE